MITPIQVHKMSTHHFARVDIQADLSQVDLIADRGEELFEHLWVVHTQ